MQERLYKERIECVERFWEQLDNVFGILRRELNMVGLPTNHDSASARFDYEGRSYGLIEGRYGWWLTRLDPRDDDDDRELPRTDFYAHYHNGVQNNQDNLLLALVELAAQPDTPARPVRQNTPTPRFCTDSEAVLLDALRSFLREEIPDDRT